LPVRKFTVGAPRTTAISPFGRHLGKRLHRVGVDGGDLQRMVFQKPAEGIQLVGSGVRANVRGRAADDLDAVITDLGQVRDHPGQRFIDQTTGVERETDHRKEPPRFGTAERREEYGAITERVSRARRSLLPRSRERSGNDRRERENGKRA
jgi:hypothetical protein